MNINYKLLSATLMLGCTADALASGAASMPATPGTFAHMIEVDVTSSSSKQTISPISRYYDLYTPAAYATNYVNQKKLAPLVIVLHPGGFSNSQPEGLIAQDSIWTTAQQCPALQASGKLCTKNPLSVADQTGILVALPNAVQGYVSSNATNPPTSYATVASAANSTSGEHQWNDCTCDNPGYGYTDLYRTKKGPYFVNVDDVAFIKAMILKIESTNAVDPARIYVTGMSNGATMALRLARELPDMIAAAAAGTPGDGASANGSSLSLVDQCQYAPTIQNNQVTASVQPNPVPLWLVKGNADADTVYIGGETNSGISNWFLPYDTTVAPDPTPAIFNGTNPGSQITTGANGLLTTSPANMNSMSLNLLRYNLSSSAYTTYAYPNIAQNDNTTYVNSSGQTVTDVSSVSCRIYGTAGTRNEVDDCIASNNGHIEPSYAVPAGADDNLAGVGNQNHDIDTVSEEWKFFQRFHL